MILQSLKEYYDRKVSDPDSNIAPEGFEHKELPFIIVLNKQGKLVQIKDTRTKIGKFLRAQNYLVPQAEKRTAGIKANLLWDNAEYVLGLPVKSDVKRVTEQHRAFIERIESLQIQDNGIFSILTFLANDPIQALEKSPYFLEIKENNPFMSFQLNTDIDLVCERKAVIDKIRNTNSKNQKTGICLITGEHELLSKLQPSIKGVRGTNTTGGNIVSFNLSAFNSYGKTQGDNAPIGEKSSFSYTTALNHLLGKDSKQKLQIGDVTIIFWSDRQTNFENNFSLLYDEPPKDNPDQLTEAVKALYESVKAGAMPDLEQKIKFFVLGLSPNAARISIRFWHVSTIAELSQKMIAHFNDLNIEHAPHEKDQLSLWRMLLSTAVQNKSDNISPNIEGEWIRTILEGLPYPDSLYQSVIRRIQVDREVSYPRASIIKGYLNRKFRVQDQSKEEVVKVSLDKENKNVAYLLGRLLAIIEKMQLEALEDEFDKKNPEKDRRRLNSTIQDKYYSRASANPNSVFPILIKLRGHYFKKIRNLNENRAFYFDRLIRKIMDNIDVNPTSRNEGQKILGFPSYLNLIEQGIFAIGYYHQREDFFKGKNLTTTETTEEGE
jgi:CRISPR-associated protein Csd1